MVSLKKEMKEARTLLRNANRGMNEIIAVMRHIDYTDTSPSNMLVIDGLVRSLAYMNACKNQGLYFIYEFPKITNIIWERKKKTDEKIRKLKAQREYRDVTYPPVNLLTRPVYAPHLYDPRHDKIVKITKEDILELK